MKASILSKLDHLSERYEEVGALLSDGDIISDQNRFRGLSKEYAELEPVVKSYQAYLAVLENINEAKLLLKDSDPDMREMGQEELRSGEAQRGRRAGASSFAPRRRRGNVGAARPRRGRAQGRRAGGSRAIRPRRRGGRS